MTLVEYKKIFLKYAPVEDFNAGIELLGQEVKSLRNKLGSLDGAHVVVRVRSYPFYRAALGI